MAFDTREYEWSDISLVIGGRDITGIRGIKHSEKLEGEALYAKGKKPHSIQTGNFSYEGSIMLLQSEYEALVKAGNGSVLNLRGLGANIGYGNPLNGDAMMHKAISGIQFTEAANDWKQGDKFIEIELPFLATDIQNNVQ